MPLPTSKGSSTTLAAVAAAAVAVPAAGSIPATQPSSPAFTAATQTPSATKPSTT